MARLLDAPQRETALPTRKEVPCVLAKLLLLLVMSVSRVASADAILERHEPVLVCIDPTTYYLIGLEKFPQYDFYELPLGGVPAPGQAPMQSGRARRPWLVRAFKRPHASPEALVVPGQDKPHPDVPFDAFNGIVDVGELGQDRVAVFCVAVYRVTSVSEARIDLELYREIDYAENGLGPAPSDSRRRELGPERSHPTSDDVRAYPAVHEQPLPAEEPVMKKLRPPVVADVSFFNGPVLWSFWLVGAMVVVGAGLVLWQRRRERRKHRSGAPRE